MNGYTFDLMKEAETAADKTTLQAALRARPFKLFHPSTAEEIENYVADDRLRDAVNVSLAVGRPLLLTGEPGTGKTSAATWIAGRLGLELTRFQVKSNSRAQDLLYTFRSIDYFRQSQIAAVAGRAEPSPADFVEPGVFWKALEASERPAALLIDEIDKAPRDFPNDLLYELDRMEIICTERNRELIAAADPGLRPIVVITSNSERRLPEPFLRRCVYHNIELNEASLTRIIDKRLEAITADFTVEQPFLADAMKCFFAMRANDALQKKPSIGEFWEWFVMSAQADAATKAVIANVAAGVARQSTLPFLFALIKLSEDVAHLR